MFLLYPPALLLDLLFLEKSILFLLLLFVTLPCFLLFVVKLLFIASSLVVNPDTLEEIFVPKTKEEKKMQRALLQYRKKENYDIVHKAPYKLGKVVYS